jgi:hypothetical protein
MPQENHGCRTRGRKPGSWGWMQSRFSLGGMRGIIIADRRYIMKLRNVYRIYVTILLLTAIFGLLCPSRIGCAAEKIPAKAQGEGNSVKPALKADWDLVSIFGDDLFPSYIVAVSMLNSSEELDTKAQPSVIGAPYGAFLIRLKSPADNAALRIEMSGTRFIRTSVFETTLKKGGMEYEIYPQVAYDYDALLAVHQAVPEDVMAKVSVNGSSLGEKTMTLRVRTINDCVFEVQNGNDTEDLSWTFSAYVNENHPSLDDILKSALKGDLTSFQGYLGDRESVLAEIKALWDAVQKTGIKYSDVSTPVAQADNVASQHVRLLGESLKYSQANCVDGTVLLASLMRKIGLKTYLMLTSDHAFLGVDLTEDGKNRVYIETTMVDDSSLDDALESGQENFKEARKKKDLLVVDVGKWRDRGILPLKDTRAEK